MTPQEDLEIKVTARVAAWYGPGMTTVGKLARLRLLTIGQAVWIADKLTRFAIRMQIGGGRWTRPLLRRRVLWIRRWPK